MSELRPESPVQRPATARARATPPPTVAPPSPEELLAIERHLVALPVQDGATLTEDRELGVTFVRSPAREPDGSFAVRRTTYNAMSQPLRVEVGRDP